MPGETVSHASLGCARCGDCCDPVRVPAEILDPYQEWIEYWRDGGDADIADADPTVRFIATHMSETDPDDTGHRVFVCSFFDQTTRECTAHELRPPMCSGFPWYGEAPTERRIQWLYPRCSYALDVPAAERRPDARPLIPITIKETR